MTNRLEQVYGRHAVRAVVLTRPNAIKKILIANGNSARDQDFSAVTNEYVQMVAPAGVEPRVLPWSDFFNETKLEKDDGHQGICVYTEPRKIFRDQDLGMLASGKLVLALDQLSNPRNFGTILRSAAYFRVDALIVHKNRSAQITPEVLKIASGAAEFIKIFQVTNLAVALETMKKIDYWIYGLEEKGSTVLSKTEFDRKTVLVVGAEGQGMRQKTKKYCDFLVRIPGSREGLESLNAGVAASIALADVSARPYFNRTDD